jgi:chromate transport protein ChrA
MHPSIFTLGHPLEAYDILYGVFLYCLPLQMACVWAVMAYLDMAEQKPARPYLWGLGVLVVPILGAAAYLLTRSDKEKERARLAVIVTGLAVWALALAIGLPKIWGPLGPKAL